VIDEGGKSHTVFATALGKLTRHKAEASDHDQKVMFEGVQLVDLLQSVGIAFGKELRGNRTPTVCIIEASDGYRVVVTLLEMDPATTDATILLVDRRDGEPLSEKEGPFRLVIPTDKRQVRWIRMIRTLRVVNLKNLSLATE